jgi:hypothetical protein
MEMMQTLRDRFYLMPYAQYAGMSFIVEVRKFLEIDPALLVFP